MTQLVLCLALAGAALAGCELDEAARASGGVDPSSYRVQGKTLVGDVLVDVDGRPGLEPVVAMTSDAVVYRPGSVFTLRRGALRRLLLDGAPVPELFPFSDEFPTGVDCAGDPGAIVVTWSRIAPGGDRFWDVRREFYRAVGTRFAFVREERFRVDVGPEAPRRWPDVRGMPFLRCPDRIV